MGDDYRDKVDPLNSESPDNQVYIAKKRIETLQQKALKRKQGAVRKSSVGSKQSKTPTKNKSSRNGDLDVNRSASESPQPKKEASQTPTIARKKNRGLKNQDLVRRSQS